jgi:hypothetical protein
LPLRYPADHHDHKGHGMSTMQFDPLARATDPLPVPMSPPAEWFDQEPDWLDGSWEAGVVQIGETGRVVALVAPYGECILDGTQNCWRPPASPTGYEFAHVGAITAADGSTVRIANVGGGVGHFDPTRATAMSPAVEHYANTASRVMIGRYHDRPDLGGIVFLGCMWPGTTNADALLAKASALSGDWRWVESLGAYDLAGSQLVNTPGFRPNRKRDWQIARLSSLNFAVVACMSPAHHDETIRGAWTMDGYEYGEPGEGEQEGAEGIGPDGSYGHEMMEGERPEPAELAMSLMDRLHALESALAELIVAIGGEDEEMISHEDMMMVDGFDLSAVPGLPYRGDDDYGMDAMVGAGRRRHKKHTKAWYTTHPSPLSSPKEIVGKHAHKPHGPSIRWPALYEHLKAKGMSKSKAAQLSNGLWRRKHGLPPKSVPKTKGKIGL